MKKMISFIILCCAIVNISSCMQKGPYEIKSPCVSIESNNPYAVSPCIRRPVNIII
ncbi:MAG: hypothetical protein K0R02_889 [Rickettsiaceae bacterium]|jgi:hypothetical protein|nr:hypothetical protein [Rickettsiaceae bacterium]